MIPVKVEVYLQIKPDSTVDGIGEFQRQVSHLIEGLQGEENVEISYCKSVKILAGKLETFAGESHNGLRHVTNEETVILDDGIM